MKLLTPFVLLLFVFSGCTQTPTDIKKVFPGWKPVTTIPPSDPYFWNTTDTIATHGPRSITRNIVQDKKGNMWFSSWEGIIGYDGKIFTNYTLKYGLHKFHTFSLLEDSNGNMWFGTIGAGVYKYDGNHFTHYSVNEGLPNNIVTAMMEDDKGNIWFGTGSGVACYNGMHFAHYNAENGLSDNDINWITQDKKGIIWIGSWGGVTCYDGKTFSAFKNQNDKPFVNVRSIVEDKNGDIWIGAQEGLYRFEYAPADSAERKNELVKITSSFTGYVFEDHGGQIWLCAGDTTASTSDTRLSGMVLYTCTGNKLTEITRRNTENDMQIFGITEDNHHHIWFGTMQGAVKYDGKTFTVFK